MLSWCDGDIEGVEYGASADMWSVGVVAFILLCGFPPFYAEEEEQLLRIVKSGHYEFAAPYWDAVSQEAMQFVRGCLQLDPDSRSTPEEALHCAWLASDEEPATPSSAPPLAAAAAAAACAVWDASCAHRWKALTTHSDHPEEV